MKQITRPAILSLILFSGVYLPSRAQGIPNYNFETWSSGSNAAPDSWQDRGSKHTGFFPVSRSADFYLGSFALKLENKITSMDTSRGFVESKQTGGKEGFNPSFPVSVRHISLTGFYKFTPQNGDSAQIFTGLFKTGYAHSQGFGNVLAFGWGTKAAAPVYTPFSLPYVYDHISAVPDSSYISITAYKNLDMTTGKELPVRGNSVLLVDALNFDSYLVGYGELDFTKNFLLYPSVTTGSFQVKFDLDKDQFISIRIYDLEGKLVKDLLNQNKKSGSQFIEFDIRDLSSGNYLFVLSSETGYRAEKIVVEK